MDRHDSGRGHCAKAARPATHGRRWYPDLAAAVCVEPPLHCTASESQARHNQSVCDRCVVRNSLDSHVDGTPGVHSDSLPRPAAFTACKRSLMGRRLMAVTVAVMTVVVPEAVTCDSMSSSVTSKTADSVAFSAPAVLPSDAASPASPASVSSCVSIRKPDSGSSPCALACKSVSVGIVHRTMIRSLRSRHPCTFAGTSDHTDPATP